VDLPVNIYIRLLVWIAYSRVPQSLEDLAEAAAIDPFHRDPVSDDNNLISHLEVLTLCQGLIAPIVSDVSDAYRRPASQYDQEYSLSHFSVQEYLESDRIRDSPAEAYWLDKERSEALLTGACVTYLHRWQESIPLERWEKEFRCSSIARYCKTTWLDHARAAEPIEERVLNLVAVYLGTYFDSWDHRRSSYISFPDTKEPQQLGGPPTAKLKYRRLLERACTTGLPSLVRFVLKTEFSSCPVRKRTRDQITAAPLRYLLRFATLLAFDVAAFLHSSYHLWTSSERAMFMIISSLLIAQLSLFWHITVESYIPKMADLAPPLLMAASSGSVPVAQALLDAGQDQFLPFQDPEVPLFEAVTSNKFDMVKHLLDNYSYRSIANTLGRAIACPILRKRSGRVETQIIRVLLQSSPGARSASGYNEEDWIEYIPPDGHSGTSLEVGVAPTLLHLIAVQGFIQSTPSEEESLALSELLAYTTKDSIHKRNVDGDTPLHLAVGRRCRALGFSFDKSLDTVGKAILQYLLEEGASLSVQNSHGAAPLHLIGFISRTEIRNELLELFSMHRANPDEPDKQGRTLLHAIACVGDGITHAIRCFPHATIDQRDHEGNTPLHFAVAHANTEGGLALLHLGADATAKNHAGATPLHMICRVASIWGHGTLETGLEFPWGYPNNWVDQAQPTNYNKHHAFALKLCQAGAEVNALDEKGNSAFHWACLYWPVHRLKNSLLDLGADVNQLNAQGRTPLDFIADDSPEVAFRRKNWYEDLEAMYLRNREWLREVGGRTAEELNTSWHT
jgi:ankyrin repeat protein